VALTWLSLLNLTCRELVLGGRPAASRQAQALWCPVVYVNEQSLGGGERGARRWRETSTASLIRVALADSD
jgi:hypothetical protein